MLHHYFLCKVTHQVIFSNWYLTETLLSGSDRRCLPAFIFTWELKLQEAMHHVPRALKKKNLVRSEQNQYFNVSGHAFLL